MNVRDLIELLGEYPAEMRVVVQGYEDGYDDVERSRIAQTQVKLNAGKEQWEGDHIGFEPSFDRVDDGDVVETVVAIRRLSN